MEYILVGAVLAGFAFFIYTRIKKAKSEKIPGGDGDRPGTDDPPMSER